MLKDAFGFALIVATVLTLWAVTPANAYSCTSSCFGGVCTYRCY